MSLKKMAVVYIKELYFMFLKARNKLLFIHWASALPLKIHFKNTALKT